MNQRRRVYLGKQGWRSGESTLLPPMWPGPDAISGLSLGWFFEGFSPGSPVFLPHQTPTYSSFHLAVSCAPRSQMDRIAAARGAIVSFWFDLVELRRCCTLRRRLAARIIFIIIIIIIIM